MRRQLQRNLMHIYAARLHVLCMWQAAADAQQSYSDWKSFEQKRMRSIQVLVAPTYADAQSDDTDEEMLQEEEICQDIMRFWDPEQLAAACAPTWWPWPPPPDPRFAAPPSSQHSDRSPTHASASDDPATASDEPDIALQLLASPFASLPEPLRSHFSKLHLALATREQRSLCSNAARFAVSAVTAAADRAVTAERELQHAERTMQTLRMQVAARRVEVAQAEAAAAAAAKKPKFCKCHTQCPAVDPNGNPAVAMCSSSRCTCAQQQRPCNEKCLCSCACKTEEGLDILCANAYTVRAAEAAHVDEQ